MTKSENSFAIFLDGDLTPSPLIQNVVAGRTIIAADGGIRHAQTLNVHPGYWIGDFDSSDDALLDAFEYVPRQKYPADKAVSDGEMAIDEAVERGAADIVLLGALGGDRADHALFHFTKAISLAKNGIKVWLTDGQQIATPLTAGNSVQPFHHDGTIFSIVGFSELEGLTIIDAKWPLNSVKVPFGSTLTLSNLGGKNTVITLQKGDAILFSQIKI
ncbi:MAG: thiamine diphosphokinase [Pseudomonadota bacterium]